MDDAAKVDARALLDARLLAIEYLAAMAYNIAISLVAPDEEVIRAIEDEGAMDYAVGPILKRSVMAPSEISPLIKGQLRALMDIARDMRAVSD